MKRSALAVCILVGASVFSAIPAQADCPDPQLQAEPVEDGDLYTVSGTNFGDDCHDSGEFPADEGELGLPIQDIDIFVVEPGGEDGPLVANGWADGDYAFEITMPAADIEGTITVKARWADGEVETPLVMSEGEGSFTPSALPPLASFGEPEVTPNSAVSSILPPLPVTVAILIAGGVLVLLVSRARRRSR